MKCTINGFEWEILEVSATDCNLNVGGASFGTTLIHYQKIYLDKDLAPLLKRKVLRHELSHAFLYCYLLDRKEEYSEEEVAEFVALYSPQILDICNKYFEKKG